MSKDTSESDAITELSKITKKFQISLDRIETFRAYEAVFGVDKPFKLEELKKFEESIELRSMLWNNRNEFKKDRKEWYDGHFRQQETEKVVAKIRMYNKLCVTTKATKIPKGQHDAVLDALTLEVADVMRIISLIEALGQSALLARHWADIFELLKEPVPTNLLEMKLQDLLDFGAEPVMNEIIEISQYA